MSLVKGIIFVHSKLDEYGLTPVQFRVLGHIARRGECNESVPRMAKWCRVHKNSMWPAIRFLESHGLIEAIRFQGQTTIYKLAPMSRWVADNPPQSNSRVGRPKVIAGSVHKVIADPHHNQIATHPPQSNSHKGNPSESNPSEGNPNKGEDVPHNFSSKKTRKEKPLEEYEDWQLEKDEVRLTVQIDKLSESVRPDPERLTRLKQRRKAIREEMRQRGINGNGNGKENPRNAGIVKGPTDYSEAFKRKAVESAPQSDPAAAATALADLQALRDGLVEYDPNQDWRNST